VKRVYTARCRAGFLTISVAHSPQRLNEYRTGAPGCMASGAANTVCTDRARQMRMGVWTSDGSPSPSGIGREASQAAHFNPRHSWQDVGMSRHAQIPPTETTKPLKVRRAQWMLVSLSLAASPVLAEETGMLSLSSHQADARAAHSASTNQTSMFGRAQPRTDLCDPDALALFDRLDRDSDGRLTRADIRRREAGRDRVRVVASNRHTLRFDLDGDGMATRQEAVSASSCASLTRQDHMPPADDASRNARDFERPAD